MKKVSLKDIARESGYSITTVSMVLNGQGAAYNIADKTQEKIHRIARQLNYRPNPHARNLRTKKSNIVGLMVPTLTNRFFSELAETFERLARENNKLALITVTHYNEDDELKAVDYFIDERADCIFTANPTAIEAVSRACSEAKVQQIVIDAPDNDKPTVSSDNFEAARVLTRNLWAYMRQSHSEGRIFYIGGTDDHAISQIRLAGFKQALSDIGLPYEDKLFTPSPFDAEPAYNAARLIFEENDDVGGLFVNSLLIMEGVVRFFNEAPELLRKVHFGVFDYHPIMSLLDINLLSIMQDAPQMMVKAFELYSSTEQTSSQIHHIPYKIIPSAAYKM